MVYIRQLSIAKVTLHYSFQSGQKLMAAHKTFTTHSKANDNDTHQGRGAANITNRA